MPKMPTFPSDDQWSIGTPDLIVSAPKYLVKANMADWFGSFYVDSGLTEDRWVKAIEVKPGDKRVVHHTIVYSQQNDEEDLAALVPDRESDGFNRRQGTRLIEYAIGNLGDVYQDGTARLMKAGAKIHFASHYHAIAEDVTEQTRVGIVFYPKGYKPKHVLQNKLVGAQNIDVPPGAADVRNDAYFTLKKPARLILFQPHMHYRGKAMALEAIYPDRRVELLTYVRSLRRHVAGDVSLRQPAGVPGWHRSPPDVVARQLRVEQAQSRSDELGRERQPHHRRDVDRPHRFHLPER